MMARGIFRAFPGIHAARMSFMRGESSIFPWPSAAIDINFVARRYYWGGAEKLEANFTTFVLNGSTLDANGLTPTGTVDITLALAGLGTYVPGSWGMAFYTLGLPTVTGTYFQIDSGANTNRIAAQHSSINARLTTTVVTANVGQTNQSVAGTETTGSRLGAALSYVTDNVLHSANGASATADTVATMPAGITTLRIGRNANVSTQPNGTIARIVLFTAAQANQAAVDALSLAMSGSW
jgi:hypothetical protein